MNKTSHVIINLFSFYVTNNLISNKKKLGAFANYIYIFYTGFDNVSCF